MNKELFEWLKDKFRFNNHAKYRKYFDRWISNVTKNQEYGFYQQMLIEKSGILELGLFSFGIGIYLMISDKENSGLNQHQDEKDLFVQLQ